MPSLLTPVILAGGMGQRLRPLTSPEHPKPFLALKQGDSLLSRTCARVAAPDFAPPVLIGAAAHADLLWRHADEGGNAPAALLLEPLNRDTALAVAVAAAWALEHAPQTTLVILPCDHHIAPVTAWHTAVRDAAICAERAQRLCLLGAAALEPRSGLGYMRLRRGEHGYEVEQFIEKPVDPAPLLASGQLWAWNIGQFIAPAEVFAELLATHAPWLWDAAQAALHGAQKEKTSYFLAAEAYKQAPSLPFDRAVVEKTAPLALMPELEWNDLGTLKAWDAYNSQME